MNMKSFLTYGGIYKFERRLNKDSGEKVKALKNLLNYMKGFIHEANLERKG